MPPPSSSSAPFRSHLMQQFAAAARHPSRTPPLALVGWIPHAGDRRDGSPHAIRSVVSSTATSDRPRTSDRLPTNPFAPVAQRLSTVAKDEEEPVGETSDITSPQPPLITSPKAASPTELSLAFQTMIRTRRSARQFRAEEDDTYCDYEMALVRAIHAAYSATPDHAPPLFFQRLLSTAARDALATIAANVYFTQELLEFQRLGQADALAQLQATAARKREQWRRIPAVLVTLVTSSDAKQVSQKADAPRPETELPLPHFDTLFDQDNVTYSDLQIYQPSPLATASRRDEDAIISAAAATQNALLSLHAEQYATRWIAGPLLQTRALGQLLRLSPSSPRRVVALLQVGREAPDDDQDDAKQGMEYFRHLQQRQQEAQRGKRKQWPDLWEDL